jgi:hypothetical protein
MRFRHKTTKAVHTFHVVCPSRWNKTQLLRYCRSEHPDETVVIEDWQQNSVFGQPWEQRLWLVNPKEMV